ncbi:MAG: hypothetical protein ACOYXM_13815 [Actinomycetota bacterium]
MKRRALLVLALAVAAATSGVLVVPRLLEDDARPLASVRWGDYEVSADGKTLEVRFFDPGCSGGYEFERIEVQETDRAVRITSLWRRPASEFCTMECPVGLHVATVTLAQPLGGRAVQQFPGTSPHCSDGATGVTNRGELSPLGSWP